MLHRLVSSTWGQHITSTDLVNTLARLPIEYIITPFVHQKYQVLRYPL